jgi:NDP-sugar pyrophosphorylase family protein
MKAMILAAGLGTRLRPLTADRPKALVEIAGRTLLEICLERLRSFGVGEAIVNVHHFAEMVVDYLAAKNNFGMRIEVSREDDLLDTGGGLKKAAWFFLEPGAEQDEPFLLHNVDVLSTLDLAAMVRIHRERDALATVAVQDRRSSRSLLFDEDGRLCGRRMESGEKEERVGTAASVQALAFSGIHVLSPRIFGEMQDEGAFSIIAAYLHLAAQGETIAAFRADGAYWRDLGRPESLLEAARDLETGVYPAS